MQRNIDTLVDKDFEERDEGLQALANVIGMTYTKAMFKTWEVSVVGVTAACLIHYAYMRIKYGKK